MKTAHGQKGITMIGFAILLGVVGFFAYAAMKLVQAYTEYFGVVKSLKLLQGQAGIETASVEQIRSMLNVQFDLQYVDEKNVPPSSIQLITQNGQRSLRIAYDRDIPFLYNVDLLVHFDKTADLTRGATY
jgi:Tfp pilus assembly major pilin PilA